MRSPASPRLSHSLPSSTPKDLPGTLPRPFTFGLLGLGLTALSAVPAIAQYTSFDAREGLGMDDMAITPDGRYAVARDTAIQTNTFVYDLLAGAKVLEVRSTLGPDCAGPSTSSCSGPCNDAVEVTDERAVTLGQQVQVIDLTTSPPSQLAEIYCGVEPRDLAITEDGAYAIVRGGLGSSGGTYVIELATGAVVLTHPSEPTPWLLQLGNDVADADDFHGVTLAYDASTRETDILVVEFNPSGGGGPRVVLDTSPSTGIEGAPMDVDISPDGIHAVVRSEDEVALLRLDGTNTSILRDWSTWPGPTFPFQTTAYDTAVISDDHWATITLGDGTVSQSYVDIEDIATGTHWHSLLDGAARDLELTPDGQSLLVHTGTDVYRWRFSELPPAGGAIALQTSTPLVASVAGLLAGLDSIVCSDDRAVAFAPSNGMTLTRVYDLTQGTIPQELFAWDIPGIPIDLSLSPDGKRAVIVTQERYLVIDLRTESVVLDESYVFGNPGYPWSDGVAVHPSHAAAFGISDVLWSGWADFIDLMSAESVSCDSLPNSTGRNGELFATGSTRVLQNDLTVHASSVTPNAFGFFMLADGTASLPLGGGIFCLGGNVYQLPVVLTGADGSASYPIDLTTLNPSGSPVVAGSTWYSQFIHREPPAAQSFNYTNASALLFE